jgi:hypothetical protein
MAPNQPLEQTAHPAGFFDFFGSIAGGPLLTGGVRLRN